MISRHLYVIQSDVTGHVKLGRANNPSERLKKLQTGSPYTLRLIYVFEHMGEFEKEMHKRMEQQSRAFNNKKHTRGEWFPLEALSALPDSMYERLPLDELETWWRE